MKPTDTVLKMPDRRICLAGDGWGAIAAYKSMNNSFDEFDVVTSDADLVNLVGSDKKILENIDESSSEIVVCAGYKPIITTKQLNEKTFINIHYSLLPKYRGLHSTVWAILNDEKELGLSVHLMNEFIDDGPVLQQYAVPNDYRSTSVHYMELFNDWVENNLGNILIDYLSGKLKPRPQDKINATWVGKRNKSDCKIDFSRDHIYLKNFFRALVDPYPLPYIELKRSGKVYSVTGAKFIDRKIETHIGRILNIDNEGIYVSSRDGYVILKNLKDANGDDVEYNVFRIGMYLNQDFS